MDGDSIQIGDQRLAEVASLFGRGRNFGQPKGAHRVGQAFVAGEEEQLVLFNGSAEGAGPGFRFERLPGDFVRIVLVAVRVQRFVSHA